MLGRDKDARSESRSANATRQAGRASGRRLARYRSALPLAAESAEYRHARQRRSSSAPPLHEPLVRAQRVGPSRRRTGARSFLCCRVISGDFGRASHYQMSALADSMVSDGRIRWQAPTDGSPTGEANCACAAAGKRVKRRGFGGQFERGAVHGRTDRIGRKAHQARRLRGTIAVSCASR